jgi:hypothetical protein
MLPAQFLIHLFAILLLTALDHAVAATVAIPAPPTLRVDYFHSGNAKSEHYALDRVVQEPLPWPGHLTRAIDDSNLGSNLFEVRDATSNALLYSRGFATVFGEWQDSEEAGKLERGFQESLRFPKPDKPFLLRILKRDDKNLFQPVWQVKLDPAGQEVIRSQPPSALKPVPILINGPASEKVDLLIIGDGYTQPEMAKFIASAKRLTAYLFSVSPFKERMRDFNVRAIAAPTPQSGVSRPSTGQYRASPLGTRYDIFSTERYVLALDNRALREIAQNAPYEFIEILVNNDTYGGGGIFGQFSTAAANNEWANYLFVHEFGHHFAGLADEYFTAPPVKQTAEKTGNQGDTQSGNQTGNQGAPSASPARPEPWEPNVTANPQQPKWQQHIKPGTALPTPWPKQEYEAQLRTYQKRRAELRQQNRPEQEMNRLFRQDLATSSALFSRAPERHTIGAFEGANYAAYGYFRSEMQCLMLDRSERMCQVCQDAVNRVVDLYTAPQK